MRVIHPNSAPVMMTKEHPRIDEFLDRMAGPHGLHLLAHCELDHQHFGRCDGKPGLTISRRILSRMGFSGGQVKQTMLYFESSKLSCDCSVYLDILNVEGAYETQLQEYRRVLSTCGASAFST